MGGSGWNGVSRKEENERLWKKGKVGQHRKFVSSRERPRLPTGPSTDWEGRAGKLCEPITNSSCGTNSFYLRALRSGALLLRVALTCWWDWRSLVSVVLRNKWRKKNIWQNAHSRDGRYQLISDNRLHFVALIDKNTHSLSLFPSSRLRHIPHAVVFFAKICRLDHIATASQPRNWWCPAVSEWRPTGEELRWPASIHTEIPRHTVHTRLFSRVADWSRRDITPPLSFLFCILSIAPVSSFFFHLHIVVALELKGLSARTVEFVRI